MLNITKFYYRYLFAKQVVIVFILIEVLYLVSMLYSSGVFDGYGLMDINYIEYSFSYYNDFVIITKMLSIIISILIVAMLNRDSSNNLAKYIVDKPIKKLSVVIGKYLVALIVGVSFLSLLFSIYLIVTSIFTPYPIVEKELLSLYLAVLQQNISYISLSFLLVSLIPNILVSLMPILLFWYMEVNPINPGTEVNTFLELLYSYIPNPIFVDNRYILVGSLLGYIIFNIVSVLLAVFISINKDIK